MTIIDTTRNSTNTVGGRPRTVHIIDIENELGGSIVTADQVSTWWRVYRDHAVGVRSDDQVIVATGHRAAATVWFALPQTGIQRRVRGGIDGADHALIESVDIPHLASRYERLVIASGDNIFTDLALRARARGMRVHQVVGKGTSSRTLTAACPTRTRIRTQD